MCPEESLSLIWPFVDSRMCLYDLISLVVTTQRSILDLVSSFYSPSVPSYVTPCTVTSLFSSTDSGESPIMKDPPASLLIP
jgi:hypothetical protein